jgi:hypothetical protein
MSSKGVKPGQWVRNPRCPDWGIGEIIGVEQDSVRVVFESGERKISTRVVELEMIEPPTQRDHSLKIVHDTPTANLKSLCIAFHELMKDNRPNSDDGRMGLNVLKDLNELGYLTRRVQKQLFAWCHTEGTVYQAGVDLARQICREVYGRVPTRDEINLLGL